MVSGSTRCAAEKGPLIAGFSMFSSHFPGFDPFDRFDRIRCQKGPGSGHSGVKRHWIRDHPGPRTPGQPGQGVPGPIQHLPRMALEGLWLPGSSDRRYSNKEGFSPPYPTTTRRETGPLSPEARSRTAAHVRHAGAGTGRCRTLYGVYPGCNGMALAGHQGHYYRGTPPPCPPCTTLFSN